MGSMHTNIRTRSSQGDELALQTTTTDAPLLPVAQLAQLRQIAPERVDWLFEETSKEAEFRRSETRRVNTLRFVKEMSALTVAAIVVLGGIGAALFCAYIGQGWVAGVFATTTIGVLAWAFLHGKAPPDPKAPRK